MLETPGALLDRLLDGARQPVPSGWLRLRLDAFDMGWLSPSRAEVLHRVLPHSALDPGQGLLHWQPPGGGASERSALLQQAALALRDTGTLSGWRDEAYVCEVPVAQPCRERGAELLRLERAAFRYLGLMSRAVHINGWLPDGRMVCGRRARSKAIDPGQLDNLAAGGLSAGEALLDCARRELFEEAGVGPGLSAGLRASGAVRSTRVEPEGLHDEVLHVYALELPADFVPSNQDGEVDEFLLLDERELVARLAAGEFTHDAALVIALGLRARQQGGRDGPG